MSLLSVVPVERLTPTRLWAHLDPDTRVAAARALYGHDWGDASTRREADAAIASSMRFRDAVVRQLPLERRAGYLAKSVGPNDSLASSLLLALHLKARRPMLAAFLDELDIAHDDGVIADAEHLAPPSGDRLSRASAALFRTFPANEVELYLASLFAMDPDTWEGLAEVLGQRAREGART